MASSGMLRRVALVRTDISEERSTSIIKVTIIGEIGTTLADRPLIPGRFLGHNSVTGRVNLQGHSAAGRIVSVGKYLDFIRNGNSDITSHPSKFSE
jgi:hypothetical protein